MNTRWIRWWIGLSPRRRILFGGVGLAVAVAAIVAGVAVSSGGEPQAVPGRPGVVLLVPGYGGSTASLDQLAARIRAAGRTATVVQLAGDGTGDLNVQARVLNGYVNHAIGAGSGPVTVIGYSAGGVVAWLWYADYGGASRAGRIITLGAPLPGAVNVPLQSVCPGADIQHSQLPTAPLVVGIVLHTLAGSGVRAPSPGDCAALQALGR